MVVVVTGVVVVIVGASVVVVTGGIVVVDRVVEVVAGDGGAVVDEGGAGRVVVVWPAANTCSSARPSESAPVTAKSAAASAAIPASSQRSAVLTDPMMPRARRCPHRAPRADLAQSLGGAADRCRGCEHRQSASDHDGVAALTVECHEAEHRRDGCGGCCAEHRDEDGGRSGAARATARPAVSIPADTVTSSGRSGDTRRSRRSQAERSGPDRSRSRSRERQHRR